MSGKKHICLVVFYFFIIQVVHKLYKAACGYTEWKANHNPDFKPWLNPDQNKLPMVNKDDLEFNNYVENQAEEEEQESEVIGDDPETYSSEDNLDEFL